MDLIASTSSLVWAFVMLLITRGKRRLVVLFVFISAALIIKCDLKHGKNSFKKQLVLIVFLSPTRRSLVLFFVKSSFDYNGGGSL